MWFEGNRWREAPFARDMHQESSEIWRKRPSPIEERGADIERVNDYWA